MDNGGGEYSGSEKTHVILGIMVALLALAGFLVWGFGIRSPFGGTIPVSVHGAVVDAVSGDPIDEVKVSIVLEFGGDLPPEIETVETTDASGRFATDGEIGYGGNRYQIGWEEYDFFPFYLVLEKDGYQPVNVLCHYPDLELRHDIRQMIQVGGLKITPGDDSAKPKEEFLPLPL